MKQVLWGPCHHTLILVQLRLGINEISKKKKYYSLNKSNTNLHFNKMNNELQTPTSSLYFW